MLNAALSKIKYLILYVFLGFLLCACESAEEKRVRQETDCARELVQKIDNALENNHFQLALNLIDSLNSTFPERTAERRTTLLSRAKAMEGLVRDSIFIADSLLAVTALEMDSLKSFFVPVREASLPGYIVDKSVEKISLTAGTAAVQPRLGDSLSPWVLEVSVPGNINIIGMEITPGNSGSPIRVLASNASERRVKGTSGEMFSFGANEANPIADALTSEGVDNSDVALLILGENGERKIPLSSRLQDAIRRTARFAWLRDEHTKLLALREKLERKLIVAQNQIANAQ